MELTIKQLKQHGQIFVPQTTAEAVLVKDGKDREKVITLDNILERKIERIITLVDSGLDSLQDGTSIILTHSNSIEANKAPSPVKVQYDNRGHIIKATPISTNKVLVDNELYNEYDGSEDQVTSMGDDFGIDKNKKIILKWKNI